MPALLAAAAILAQPAPSRWETVSPLPGISWIKAMQGMEGAGLANREARRTDTQARILWVDGSANIGPVSTEAGVVTLVQNAVDAGFNTLVYDVKPIVGRTMYPSRFADQLTSWKGVSMPAGHDPLRLISREVRRHGLTLLVSLNAFSEGHSYAKRDEGKPDTLFGEAGWGYEHPELQTVQYRPLPIWQMGEESLDIFPTLTPAQWQTPLALYNRLPNSQSFDRAFVLDGKGWIKWQGAALPESLAADETLMLARGNAAQKVSSAWARGLGKIDSRAEFHTAADGQNQIPLMMNPHDDRNQQRALSFVHEVMANYDVDGLLYDDRLRFGGLDTDFHESTLLAFEQHVGREVNVPEDIYKVTFNPRLGQGIQPGPLFDAWLAWRAQEMKQFVIKVREEVKEQGEDKLFGIYAGSWYGDYPRYGANYGDSRLHAGFPFLTRAYRDAGFADQLDMLITGCYYPVPTVFQALERNAPPGRTVEAGGIISQRVARDQTWTIAGIMIVDYARDPKAFEHAMQAAASTTQGVMVFDYSHDISQYWPMLKRAFRDRKQAPYQVPGLLERVRSLRAEWDKKNYDEDPFPLFEGAPGAGF